MTRIRSALLGAIFFMYILDNIKPHFTVKKPNSLMQHQGDVGEKTCMTLGMRGRVCDRRELGLARDNSKLQMQP